MNWKKIKFLLKLRDGIWSIPLTFLAFYALGLVLGMLFGYGTGSYDPGLFQALFLAIAVVVGTVNAAVLGLWFTLRGLHRYIYGKMVGGRWTNYSKTDFKNLQPWQRVCIALFSLFFFVVCILLVFLKLV